MNLSVVVLTKNEEANLGQCLKGLGFAEEIIVIDDYSKDKTEEVARRYAAKVFKRHLGESFAAQRNFGLEKASGRWVLFVDPDERVGPNLGQEILEAVKKIDTVGYYLVRRERLFGKFLKYGEFSSRGGFGNTRLLRLGRKGAGVWKRRVHEYWDLRGKNRQLKNPLLHYPHPTLKEFLNHINFFSSLHAQAIVEEGKRPTLIKIVVWPWGKFVYNMVFRLGFLDGMEGFVVGILMSFNSFLAWSKAWLNQRRAY
jgi:glycosyltransferase involved in cell wall biosynthesis